MGLLQKLCDLARDTYVDGDGRPLILAINPVVLMKRQHPLHPPGAPRTRRAPLECIRLFWHALKLRGELGEYQHMRTSADLLRYRFMTGARPTEPTKMVLSNVDFDNAMLVMPGAITKNHHPLPLPMSRPMRELMDHRLAVHRADFPGVDDGWVFASDRGKTGHLTTTRGTVVALAALATAARRHVNPDSKEVVFSEHDIRRMFEDVATECKIDPDVRRRLLNHRGDVHQIHYANNPEALVEAVKAIAEWLDAPLSDSERSLWDALGRWEGRADGGRSVAATASAIVDLEQWRDWRSLPDSELATLVWQVPVTHIAAQFGLTDAAVHKRCKRLGIRGPQPGYWQKVKAGKIPKKAPSQPAARLRNVKSQ